jgi:hypothetical protein
VTREAGTARSAGVAIDFDYAIAQDIHSEPTIEWAIDRRCARHDSYVPLPMDRSTFQGELTYRSCLLDSLARKPRPSEAVEGTETNTVAGYTFPRGRFFALVERFRT